MQCHGRHADGSKCENFAEPNGFCKLHQEQASMEIIQNLSIIQQELKALQQLKVVDPNHISRIQGEIQDLKKRQRKYGLECFQSEDCRSKMQSLAIDLETLLSPDGQDLNLPKIVLENMDQVSATERLTNATQDLAYLSQTSTIDPTMAKWEVSKSQEARNAEKILDLQTTIDAIGAESEEKQRSTRNEINQLQNQLQDTISEKQQITSIEEQLQQQLANSQAQSVNVTEQYSLHTANLQDELLKYKSMYETLQAREMRLNVSLKQFEESEVQLNNQVRDLKDSYEQKLKNLQDDYANKVQQGATILSEREQQLMQDIAHLQRALKTNLDELSKAQDTNKIALADMQSSGRPCAELATELLSIKERMSSTSKQMYLLQEERDNLVARKAEYEIHFQRRLAEGQATNDLQISRLNQELQTKNHDIMAKQQEATALRSQFQQLKAGSESKMSQLNMQLVQTQFDLRQYRDKEAQQNRMFQERERMLADQSRSIKLDGEFKLKQMDSELRQKYQERFRDLENKVRYAQDMQNQQVRELKATQSTLNAREQMINQQQAALDENQANFQSRMLEYTRQKDQLNAAIQQAKQRGDQLAKLEQDFKRRVESLQQSSAIDREQFLAETKSLKSQLSDALQSKALIQANLTQCATNRDNMMLQVNQLNQENTRLKNQFLNLQAQFDQSQVQHSVTIEKLRTDANHLQSNMALCASQLEEVPAIHAHNKELESKMHFYRNEVLKHERDLDEVRSNLVKAISEKDFAAQKIQQLQMALKSCDNGKQVLQSNQQMNAEQIRSLQRMEHELENAVQTNAKEFEYVLNDRDREYKRQLNRQKSQEISMKSQIKELNMEKNAKNEKIRMLQNQKSQIVEAMTDSNIANTEQVAALSLNDYSYSQRPTGKSRLISK